MVHPMTSQGRPILLVLFLILLLLIPVSSATSLSRVLDTPTPDQTIVIIRTVDTNDPVTTVTTAAPQTGYMAISSSPAGASVTIDGTTMGTTPFAIRTLTTGSHSLLLQLIGYQDLSTSFIIQPDTMNQESYTLAPIPTETREIPQTTSPPYAYVPSPTPTLTVTETRISLTETQVPIITTVLATPTSIRTLQPTPTATPLSVQQLTVQMPTDTSLGARLQQIPAVVEPIKIRVGNHTKSPIINTYSPWFAAQFVPNNSDDEFHFSPSAFKLPLNYLEVDEGNVNLKISHLMSSNDVTNDPVWGDQDTAFIASTETNFDTNYRWITLEPDATALYQIAKDPFSTNDTQWQNEYVPGLVDSGPANDVFVDKEGFHYFIVNFATIANHNPTMPPVYSGYAKLQETVPGQGIPMGLAEIPFTSSGIWIKKIYLGPVVLPFPDSLASIPAGTLTEAHLGNPNGNMIVSSPDAHSLFPVTPFVDQMMDMDQTFFIRVVPICKNGTAGIPTLPVTVTVKRPQPCPTNTVDKVNDLIVKPPTAEIKSFYMNLLIPDWIRTDQNGALRQRAHFVTVIPPLYCSATHTGNQITDSSNAQFCAMYGGNESGYHFYADPAESHWYDTVWDIIKGMFFALSTVVNSASAAWAQINNIVVQIAAVYVQGLTFGAFDCNSSSACTGILHAALSTAECALGIPPTIPNFADLQSMGADYMAKVAAEELGIGGAYDAAQSAYAAMPDSAKQAITENADDIGQGLGDSMTSQTGGTLASAAGNWYIPDPLYYKPHPATVIISVTNPNMQTTDSVRLSVSDTKGLFSKVQVMVPPLKAYDSTVIPVILTEDYTKVYKPGCDSKVTNTIDGVPCYWENWNQAAMNAGTDQFVIEMSTKKNGQWITGLTPSSSGKVLTSSNVITWDESGNNCPGYKSTTLLKYPAGWKMQQAGWYQDLSSVMWNRYTFTEGAKGRMISG